MEKIQLLYPKCDSSVNWLGTRACLVATAVAFAATSCGDRVPLEEANVQRESSALVAATYYVSPTGTGSVCSISSPCSLATARGIVQGMSSMTGDIDIRLLSGTYVQSSTLSFLSSDGGKNGFHVIYESNPGGHAVISSGKAITGWTQVAGTSQWRASIASTFTTRQLYVNGVRAVRAQGTIPGTLTQTSTGYTSTSSAMSTWGNPTHIELVSDAGWTEQRCGISSISGTTITMNQPCFANSTTRSLGINIGLPTFVENAFEVLDQPGEWYLDRSANVIYYIPRSGENLATADVEAPAMQSLVTVGTTTQSVQNLTFRGLTFSYAGWLGPDAADGFSEMQANYALTGTGAAQTQGFCLETAGGTCPYGDWTPPPANLTFTNTNGLTLERNTFTHLGAAGVSISDFAANTSIVGNVFSDISGNGLMIGGVHNFAPTNLAILPTNTVIRNNWVTRVGADYPGAVGIFQGYTVNSLIEHNQINGVPYSGISSGWSWGYPASSTSINTPASGNIIRANLVFDHMLRLHDGGGIYLLGSQGSSLATGALVAYNVVHGQRTSSHGIYTDSGSQYVTIDHNVGYDNASDDWGGCQQSGTPFGHFVASNDYWANTTPGFSCSSDQTLGGTVTKTNLTTITGPNDVPAAIVNNAGLEAAYEDIRADTGSRINLAYRRPAQAQFLDGSTATMQVGSEAGAAVDDDTTTAAQASVQWRWQLVVDLLDYQYVDRFNVTMPATAYATAFHIDVSLDGASYTTVATKTGTTSGTTAVSISPTAARYVRIVADKPDGAGQTGGQMSISELAVYGVQDMAFNKKAYARFLDGTTATMQPGSNAAEAIDGIGSTAAQASGQWKWALVVDLLAARSVGQVFVTMPSTAFATQWHLDASLDDHTYTTVANVTGSGGSARVALSPAVVARYLRVVADKPDGPGQTGGQMSISRLSAYPSAAEILSAATTAQFLDGTTATMQPWGTATNGTDGDATTYAQASNQWLWRLGLDLGATKTFNEIHVLMPAAAFATAFHVDSSTNGTSYSTIETVTTVGVGGEVQYVLPSATSARYLRVVADAPNAAGQRGGQMGITEVVVQ